MGGIILVSSPALVYMYRMDLLTILLIALALAVDAFAVALASGVSLCQVSKRQTFRLSFHFGFFQAMMNIIGWGAGHRFKGQFYV